jgi:hypothetical protein
VGNARVRFTLERARPGSRRFIRVHRSYARTRHTGTDRFGVARVAGGRLRPGRYRLFATPTARGRSGITQRASFRIAR